MISSGTSALLRWTCSASGRISSSAKRRNVSCTISKSPVEVARAGVVGERGERTPGRGRCATNVAGAGAARGSTPHSCLAADQLRAPRSATASATKAHVSERLDRRPWRRSRASTGRSSTAAGVGEVVGEHLVGVGPAALGELARPPCPTTGRRGRRRRRRPGDRGVGHAQRMTDVARASRALKGRAAMRTMRPHGVHVCVYCGSSPGFDPV